ncbi:MAG: hypothetical protein ABL958_16555 [Bdellovibrionia bacterium]
MFNAFAVLFGLLAPSLAHATTFEDLRSLIESNGLKTIEDVLPRLSPVLKSNYVLVHTSRSLQSATPSQPRAILFEPGGYFLMAFNSASAAKGAQSLEVVQYRYESGSFEFRNIEFSAEGAKFSDANPARCFGCHRADPRPNWESYPFWPGAYGTNHRLPPTAWEMEQLKAFADRAPADARYKNLTNVPARIGPLMSAPNLSLSYTLTYLNVKRIIRLMRDRPYFEAYKYAVGALLGQCGTVEELLPSDLFEFHALKNLPLAELTSQTRNMMLKNRTEEQVAFDVAPKRLSIIAGFRYLFEALGPSIESWSTSVDRETYRFSSGSDGIRDVTKEFLSTLENPTDCRTLKTRSRAALEAVKKQIIGTTPAN